MTTCAPSPAPAGAGSSASLAPAEHPVVHGQPLFSAMQLVCVQPDAGLGMDCFTSDLGVRLRVLLLWWYSSLRRSPPRVLPHRVKPLE